jgi:hypothetical protein
MADETTFFVHGYVLQTRVGEITDIRDPINCRFKAEFLKVPKCKYPKVPKALSEKKILLALRGVNIEGAYSAFRTSESRRDGARAHLAATAANSKLWDSLAPCRDDLVAALKEECGALIERQFRILSAKELENAISGLKDFK